MTELELQGKIIDKALKLGLLVHTCNDSRRCGVQPGFPDLTIVGSKAAIYREIKGEQGEPSSAQRTWKWRMLAAGCDWALWKPSDLASGRIDAELGRLV